MANDGQIAVIVDGHAVDEDEGQATGGQDDAQWCVRSRLTPIWGYLTQALPGPQMAAAAR